MMLTLAALVVIASLAHSKPLDNDLFTADELRRYFGVANHDDAPEYEFVSVEVVEADAKRSVGRSTIADSSLRLEVEAFGERLGLVLNHDDSGFEPGVEVHYIGDNEVVKEPLRTDCVYTGIVESEEDSLVSVTTCEGVMAIIIRKSGSLYLEPLGQQDTMKRDIGRGLPHVAYRNWPLRNRAPPVFDEERRDDIDGTKEPPSVALRCTCNDTEPPSLPLNGMSDNEEPPLMAQYRRSVEERATARKYIKLTFLADYNMYLAKGSQTADKIKALFTAAKTVLQLPSLVGELLVPKITTSFIIMSPSEGPARTIGSSSYLHYSAVWLRDRNYPESHDNHWDNAVVLTGMNLIDYSYGIDVLGRAYVSACDDWGVSVSEFYAPDAHVTIAHELGHNLGMQHDSFYNTCDPQGYVMGAYGIPLYIPPMWSTCSRAYYNARIKETNCYDDE